MKIFKFNTRKKNLVLVFIFFFLILLMCMIWMSKSYFNMTFSEKIHQGYSTNIVINGDSIGGSGSNDEWPALLQEKLQKNYNSLVDITNISKPGNDSFAGIVSWQQYLENKNGMGDLVILCYGQNDTDDNTFKINYEALIRNTIRLNPNAEIVAILESSQREYTNKIQIIKKLCDYYDIFYVDTIAAFESSGYVYDDLSADGVHPNQKGSKIYADAIYDVIEKKILKKHNIFNFMGKRLKLKEAQSSEVERLENCHYISIDEMEITGNTILTEIPASTIIGIDMVFIDGNHKIKLNIADKEYNVGYSWNYGFNQRHMYPVLQEGYEPSEVSISFEENALMDNFLGLIYFE